MEFTDEVEIIENFESKDTYLRDWEEWYKEVDEEMTYREMISDLCN